MASDTRKNLDPNSRESRSANRDAITGAPGSHPVGTGVGAAGAGAAGALIGSVGGPVGTAVGAVVGAVAGGLAGKGVGEAINPTEESAYWRNNYRNRPYVTPGSRYEDYEGAYRHGWESREKYAGKRFEDVESNLRSEWDSSRSTGGMEWDRAKSAMRDAWEHIDNRSKSGACNNSSGDARTPATVTDVSDEDESLT